MRGKKLLIALTVLTIFLGQASALDLNSTTDLRYFPDTGAPELVVDTDGNLNMTGDNITNFFDQDKCGSDEAVKTVYPNGSYACNSISSDQTVENLSETLAAGNVANQTIEFGSGTGVQIGDEDTLADNEYSVAIGGNSSTAGTSFYPSVAIGRDVDASGASSVAIGRQSRTVFNDGVAIGNIAETTESEAIALGYGAGADGGASVALGAFSEATEFGAMALGNNAVADEQYTVELGSSSQAYDLNVNGGSVAVGDNTQDGLSSGDINASDIYYNSIIAKSPVVSCSQGTDWCEVSEPEKQDHYFVKTDESFDKDRPKETALEVVESDVETVEKFEELREENERQEEKIENLNQTVEGLKSVVCEDNPEAEVCN